MFITVIFLSIFQKWKSDEDHKSGVKRGRQMKYVSN